MATPTAAGAKIRKVSPLFPEPYDDAGSFLYADEIGSIVLYHQRPGAGNRSRRIRVSRRDFEMEDGSFFVIDPTSSTEDDIEDQFGAGEYYIEPRGPDNKILAGGRAVVIGSTPDEREGDDDDDDDDGDDSDAPPPADPVQLAAEAARFAVKEAMAQAQASQGETSTAAMLKMITEMNDKQQSLLREQMATVQRQPVEGIDMATKLLAVMKPDPGSNNAGSRAVEDDLRKALSDERSARIKSEDSLRDTHRDIVKELNTSHSKEIEEITRRRRDDEKRADAAYDEMRSDLRDQIKRLQGEFDALKRTSEKKIEDLTDALADKRSEASELKMEAKLNDRLAEMEPKKGKKGKGDDDEESSGLAGMLGLPEWVNGIVDKLPVFLQYLQQTGQPMPNIPPHILQMLAAQAAMQQQGGFAGPGMPAPQQPPVNMPPGWVQVPPGTPGAVRMEPQMQPMAPPPAWAQPQQQPMPQAPAWAHTGQPMAVSAEPVITPIRSSGPKVVETIIEPDDDEEMGEEATAS